MPSQILLGCKLPPIGAHKGTKARLFPDQRASLPQRIDQRAHFDVIVDQAPYGSCVANGLAVAAMAARFLFLMTETPLSNRVAGDFRDSENLFSEHAQGSPRFFDRVGVSWHSTDPAGRERAARLLGVRAMKPR